MRFMFLAVVVAVVAFIPAVRAEPVALMKKMDGFRKEIPSPTVLSEMNGFSIEDVDGKYYAMHYLSKGCPAPGGEISGRLPHLADLPEGPRPEDPLHRRRSH